MRRKTAIAGVYVLTFVSLAWSIDRASGQECPSASAIGPSIASEVRTLEGRLVFHNGVRSWFELQLDQPQCGQSSIELIQIEKAPTRLATFRGCRIRSSGAIDLSHMGYYSLGVFQDVKKIEPVGVCALRPPFPDYSRSKPSPEIRAYRVDMHVNYRPGDHPIVFHVSSAGEELRPWQAYADYWLTGGSVLYGRCGRGFVIDKVFGTPQAKPEHFDDPRTSRDMAEFDPESAAQSGKRDLHLGYTCIRSR